MAYQLLTYETAQGPRGAVHVDKYVYDLGDVTGNSSYSSVLDALKEWDDIRPRLEQFARDPASSKTRPRLLSEVKLLAPNPTPGAVFCAGGAYNDHGGEMDKILKLKPAPTLKERGERPFFFLKNATGVCGPNSTTRLDPHISTADWELELCVVIGRTAKNVPEEKALDYVAGYTIGNDLSYREYIRRDALSPGEPFYYDWFSQKCFDSSCPTGPWIVPTRQVEDPQNLDLKLWVGDELMQNTSTSHMIFPVAEQVATLSRQLTLHPGDIIMTGTGGGVGLGRGRFLQPGETLRASIENVGEFVHHIG
ncbi:Fumarylacetoacetate hydrolase domain-containing protein 2 [Fusarium oxysporum f. sp. cubense]|uniref:Fumarylacetoacetate hydrolase domain-containing protein 2 n=1 Tax=Fusarium oxysporum f. sp. cubense TaxID=61366 RepID=A0A559LLM6_FUSOC|nr:Fumarylacetoacetate hydrolase domain-containing protein 2 [Fusarium oxysporum f. sp. cubense]